MVLSLEELQSSCGVSACTLIPQESPPSVIINKEKSRKSTTNDNRAYLQNKNIKESDSCIDLSRKIKTGIEEASPIPVNFSI